MKQFLFIDLCYLTIYLDSLINFMILLIIMLGVTALGYIHFSSKITETVGKGILTGIGIAIGKQAADTVIDGIKSGNTTGDNKTGGSTGQNTSTNDNSDNSNGGNNTPSS